MTIYDVGEHDGRAFMVMELMRGGTVGERLKAGRAIADETALRWLREAAGALDAAHEAGVVHRDIKPGNLLLDDRDRLAIADFGIARLAMEDQLTATGQVLGTAAYISPEQAVGEPATAASDRYALAVVAFELLTGAKPFQAEHFAAQARAHVEDPPPLGDRARPVAAARASTPCSSAAWPRIRAIAGRARGAMVAALDRAMGSSRPATEPTRPIAAPAPAPPPAAGAARPPRRARGRTAAGRCWRGLPASSWWPSSGSCCSPAATAAARTAGRRRAATASEQTRAAQEGHADADADGRAHGRSRPRPPRREPTATAAPPGRARPGPRAPAPGRRASTRARRATTTGR